MAKPEQVERYLADRQDYNAVERVKGFELIEAWYGIIYTNNKSPYILREELCFTNIDGMEVIYPRPYKVGDPIDFELKPGEDHILLMRRFEG